MLVQRKSSWCLKLTRLGKTTKKMVTCWFNFLRFFGAIRQLKKNICTISQQHGQTVHLTNAKAEKAAHILLHKPKID